MSHDHISCEEVIKELFAYLDHEVDEGLSERIEHHLERCRDCFSRADFEKKLRDCLKQSTEASAPDRLRQRIHQAIKNF